MNGNGPETGSGVTPDYGALTQKLNSYTLAQLTAIQENKDGLDATGCQILTGIMATKVRGPKRSTSANVKAPAPPATSHGVK